MRHSGIRNPHDASRLLYCSICRCTVVTFGSATECWFRSLSTPQRVMQSCNALWYDRCCVTGLQGRHCYACSVRRHGLRSLTAGQR